MERDRIVKELIDTAKLRGASQERLDIARWIAGIGLKDKNTALIELATDIAKGKHHG